jgi:hypothetical protein
MQMTLQRGVPGNLSIPGELLIGGAHAYWTLENKVDAIPAGTYEVYLYDSPKFDRPMPLIAVPGRSYIEIHWGNSAANFEGCVGVGETRDTSTEEIFYTQAAFTELFPIIKAAVLAEGCSIEVLDALVPPVDLSAGDL